MEKKQQSFHLRFNEAGAFLLRKSYLLPRFFIPRLSCSFNEAGAFLLRKSVTEAITAQVCAVRFDEAGAFQLRESA